MLKAILFDFDGVIVDSEPVHFVQFRRVLLEEGISLSREEYAAAYLALDDRTCFAKALRRAGRSADAAQVRALVARKAAYFAAHHGEVAPVPGAPAFIARAAACYPLAIGSGSSRADIEGILGKIGLRRYFSVLVSSEDYRRGKPDPECFLNCLERLNAGRATPIQPAECLVLEDGLPGIAAARAAGMHCLAVASSHTPEQLCAADHVVADLAGLDPDALDSLFA